MDEALSYENLLKGAKKFSGLALQAHRDGDEEIFVLHAGLSIERLMKACLAKANPVLLMESAALKDDRALLHFAGLRLHGERVRTVSASGALGRIRAAGWLPKDPNLDDLIELRNGVVHLGPTNSGTADLLATFGRTTNQILTRLELTTEDYWGDWAPLINITLNDQLERVERETQRKIEQVRHRWRDRIKGMPGEVVDALKSSSTSPFITSIQTHRIEDGPILVGRATCPSCDNNDAILFLTRQVQEDRGFLDQVAGFSCTLCGLRFSHAAEVEAAGITWDEIPIPIISHVDFEKVIREVLQKEFAGQAETALEQ